MAEMKTSLTKPVDEAIIETLAAELHLMTKRAREAGVSEDTRKLLIRAMAALLVEAHAIDGAPRRPSPEGSPR